ncbi:dihydroorotase [Candidatus Cyanaurora vandensis]|uniref:dihydroorotase n=1 Tax=Candidatus Cyanaurora vandensis TaxID=2714958 RepID=UPI00257BD498|nr:dihydroorotase [Candidatus Cyanaurora vandensis]
MELTLTRPDDGHLHLRDGGVLPDLVQQAARTFKRAIIMPNLTPPITTTDLARAYRARIQAVGTDLEPLMTLYLTETMPPAEIQRAVESGIVQGVKLYPAGATTNSEAGVRDLTKVYPVLAAMEAADLPLLVHGEVVRPEVDIFDRERIFLEEQLHPLLCRFPQLRVVLEHATTREAVDFVREAPGRMACTLTAHHLLLNRNDFLVGGIRPHYYCLPVLKREVHRLALVEAATSGDPRFFLGTDSAPHAQDRKETACGCAGVYTAPLALELYTEVFERAGALAKLEAFASFHGADFYGLPRNQTQITLTRTPWTVPLTYPLSTGVVVPLRAGEILNWQVKEQGD